MFDEEHHHTISTVVAATEEQIEEVSVVDFSGRNIKSLTEIVEEIPTNS